VSGRLFDDYEAMGITPRIAFSGAPHSCPPPLIVTRLTETTYKCNRCGAILAWAQIRDKELPYRRRRWAKKKKTKKSEGS
jgi:DNA-directed RNA polymerase subunit RPC12/RpoP